jgi:diguanylate cyclase (GGDEF)-like protein
VNPTLIILSVLLSTSGVMWVAMTLAWVHFGRERHVLLWSCSYALSMMQWVAMAGGMATGNVMASATVDILALASSALAAIGSRQRSGLEPHWGRFAAVMGVGAAGVILAFSPSGSLQMQGGIGTLIAAGLMTEAARALRRADRSFTAPEWALFGSLTLFAIFLVALAMVAIFLRPDASDGGMALHRAMLAFGMPPIYLATGVSAVLVIAGDLAAQLRSMVSYDQLTGILNRRGMEQAAAMAIANAKRQKRQLAAVICDLDSFKALNDGYGHIAGDSALRAFAGVLLAVVRKGDVVGRLGGDEFCILLVDSSGEAAMEVMDRVRTELSALEVSKTPAGSVKASFGVADSLPSDVALDDLIGRADRALYVSKQRGRDCVTLWSEAIA